MKKHLPSFLPALALLTLGGCATTSNLATTENDGMYYSAADKVTAMPVAQSAPVGDPGDVVNPDYNGSSARGGESEYYDDDYYASSPQRNNYRNNYRGGSLGYYSFPYADPFFYGYGAPIIGYSPYSPFGYSPYGFYDPFYRPHYGYGGLTINIGFGWGNPWGFNRFGGWGNPWAYNGFGGWGGGLYGGGYYGNGYYNNGGYYGNNGYYGVGADRPARNVTYGPRRSRTGNGAGLADVPNGSASAASPGRSRVVQEGRFVTPGNGSVNTPAGQYNGRGRVRDVTAGNGSSSASGQPASATESGSRTSRFRDTQSMPGAATASQPADDTRRWRVLDNSAANNGAPASSGRMVDRPAADQPQSGRGRRATYYSGDNNSNSGTAQPQRQRTTERRSYSEPTRSYSEPAQSYSQPSQPSRSYSEPSRSSSPSSSSPGNSGSSGGNSGGRGRVR
ncbi:hypothetical protein [Hymenobacter psychrophilus]|uniref:Vitellogenin II n=1 Tax=Hymenobacter psychrophilus TaxID=651662 RepID=A0A1H3MHC0_9BACT|nr:hypothetical protein [Hymenobacter psychrophilus]SDY76082.1 hypothetical protein SAMN04488069_1133 [Hymenobacter psychrophilus]